MKYPLNWKKKVQRKHLVYRGYPGRINWRTNFIFNNQTLSRSGLYCQQSQGWPEFLKGSSEDWPRLTEPLPSPIEVRKWTTMICNEQPAANSEVVCRDSSKLTTGSKCD
ncbi:hypothetical protein ACLKA7_007620 [Drosophila subpalustris]